METRANYVLIGLFTLAVVLGVFGFIYWFQNIGGSGERSFYRVRFEGSVSGLRTGSSVMFNGIRVGEVTGLQLDPTKPQQVVVNIAIDKNVAVREDTDVGPLATPQILETVAAQVDASVRAGARLLIGGKRLTGPGNFYQVSALA